MRWESVRKTNRIQSARKAKREQAKAAADRRIAESGGPITLAEVREAVRREEPPAPGHVHPRLVWRFRDRDWVLGYSDGDSWQAFSPFVSYRQDPQFDQGIPLTPAAKKWLLATLCVGHD